MQHDDLFKFKIGEFVTTVLPYHSAPIAVQRAVGGVVKELKNHRIPLQVIERQLQECPGGVQIHYKVRPHFLEIKESKGLTPITESYWQVWGGGPVVSFNEIELETFTIEAIIEEERK